MKLFWLSAQMSLTPLSHWLNEPYVLLDFGTFFLNGGRN